MIIPVRWQCCPRNAMRGSGRYLVNCNSVETNDLPRARHWTLAVTLTALTHRIVAPNVYIVVWNTETPSYNTNQREIYLSIFTSNIF